MARALKVVMHSGPEPTDDSARAALLQIDGVRVVGEIQNGAELPDRLRNLRPDILVAHLGTSNPHEQVTQLCDVVKDFEHLALIAVGPTDDAGLLRQAMRAGVHDIIGEPVNPEELLDCLQRILEDLEQRAEGKLIGVRGTGGGSGATTMAVNLAVEIEGRIEGRVAIVDLDLQFGQVASMLDLAPQFTIADLCQDSGDMEQSVLEGAMTEHGSGVWVLARPKDPDSEASQVNLVRTEAILSALPSFFEVVIVDENSRSNMTNRVILNMAANLVIVSQPVVTSVRNAAEMIRSCGSLGYDPDRLKLVLNRMRKKGGALTIDAIERNLKRKVDYELPDDPDTVCEAINLGKPLGEHAPGSKVHGVICELAAALCRDGAAGNAAAEPAKKSRGGLFGALFGG